MRIQNSNEPFAIRILTWLAGLASAGMYLSILLVLLKIGPVMMGGERVTRTEWLHIAAPLVAAIGILMAMICYAIASRKPWSRHLVIARFTLISSPPSRLARSAQSMMYPKVAVVPATITRSQAPRSK